MSLKVKDLKIYYNTLKGKVRALDDISFEVYDKEILGLAGESGCGKSTLSNSLILLEPPMTYIGGEVYLDDKVLPIQNFDEMNKFRYTNISIIPQYAMNALNPIIKIGEYVKSIIKSKKIPYTSELEKEFIRRLEFVSLDSQILKRYPIELSGGMKQRVVMVISTLLNPSLLIADEITSALDVTTQKMVSELLVEFISREFVKSVVFVTHDVSVLYQIASRIMIMYAGNFMEVADTETIIHSPRHPYTKMLTDSMPEVGIKHEQTVLSSIPGKPPGLLDPPKGCRFHPRCPFAKDICRNSIPEKITLKKGHEVQCWKVSSEEGTTGGKGYV